jgi:hypothetical protein
VSEKLLGSVTGGGIMAGLIWSSVEHVLRECFNRVLDCHECGWELSFVLAREGEQEQGRYEAVPNSYGTQNYGTIYWVFVTIYYVLFPLNHYG